MHYFCCARSYQSYFISRYLLVIAIIFFIYLLHLAVFRVFVIKFPPVVNEFVAATKY